MNTINSRSKRLRYIIKIAILSAVSTLVMLFEIPLPFIAPPFYELDFSEAIILMGSFAMGPVSGVIMELLKNILNALIFGTDTAYVGEFANFVIGTSFVLPAALVYKYKKNFNGALVGMGVGTLSLGTIGALFNYYFLIPAFSNLYGLPLDSIVGMATQINPAIINLESMVVLAVAPFNIIKGIICSLLSLLLYKRISKILHF